MNQKNWGLGSILGPFVLLLAFGFGSGLGLLPSKSFSQGLPEDLGVSTSAAERSRFETVDYLGTQQTNALQYNGPSIIVGPYSLHREAVARHYHVSKDSFGRFLLMLPGNPPKPLTENGTDEVKYLGEGLYNVFVNNPYRSSARRNGPTDPDWLGVGIRPIPVASGFYKDEQDAIKNGIVVRTKPSDSGEQQTIVGSTQVDRIWKTMVYGDPKFDGVIFAPIVYSNPNKSKGGLDELNKLLKTEQGMTHMGLYYGRGLSINSPIGYHQNTWWAEWDCGELSNERQSCKYPAQMFSVHYQYLSSKVRAKSLAESKSPQYARAKVDAILKEKKDFNQNALTVLHIINEFNGGPWFPPDYKHDWYQTLTLKDHLEFFADWIEGGDKANKYQKDQKLQHYCAEHITIGLNIALNVPQNLAGYQSVYGQTRGKQLWETLKKRWVTDRSFGTDGVEKVVGSEPLVETPASFVPLWKVVAEQADNRAKSIRDPERRKKFIELVGSPAAGKAPKSPTSWDLYGLSVAWPAETTADLMADFMGQYLRFSQVGAVVSTLGLLGFEEEAVKRLRLDPEAFVDLTVPFVRGMFEYDLALRFSRMPIAQRTLQVAQQVIEAQRTALREVLLSKALKGAATEAGAEVAESQSQQITKSVEDRMTKLFGARAATTGFLSQEMVDRAIATAARVESKLLAITRKSTLTKNSVEKIRNDLAYVEFQRAMSGHMKKARDLQPACDVATDEFQCVKYYSPPAILARLVAGLHEYEPLLRFAVIGTVMDGRDLMIQENCLKTVNGKCVAKGEHVVPKN